MNELNNFLVDALAAIIKPIVKEAVREALNLFGVIFPAACCAWDSLSLWISIPRCLRRGSSFSIPAEQCKRASRTDPFSRSTGCGNLRTWLLNYPATDSQKPITGAKGRAPRANQEK
jgi:hypothetical protein